MQSDLLLPQVVCHNVYDAAYHIVYHISFTLPWDYIFLSGREGETSTLVASEWDRIQGKIQSAEVVDAVLIPVSGRSALDTANELVYSFCIDRRQMSDQEQETRQLRLDRRLMKMGGSLVLTLPKEVIQEWNLSKGDEVTLEVLDGAVRIGPKQPTKLATISEASLEEYSRVMKGIRAKVTMDPEAASLRIELTGQDRKSVSTVLNNLWRNIPFLLNMLGLGSVAVPESKVRRRERRKHGRADVNEVA